MSSSFVKGSCFTVVVTHVESECRGALCEIWAQTEMAEYDKLAGLLESPPQTALVTLPRSGDIVLACYAEDGQWYRAQIIAEMPNKRGVYRLQFVDYGNVEMVKLADMVVPSRELCAIPPLGEKFILDGVSPRNGCSWADFEIDFLKQHVVNQELTAKVVEKGTTGFPATVQLSVDLSSVFKPCRLRPLTYTHITKEDNLPVDLCIDVELTHAESKLNFWVQRVSVKRHVEKLNQEICMEIDKRLLSRLSLENVYPGMICAAKSQSVNSYARAVICDVSSSASQSCVVTFIDYGTTDLVDVQGLHLLTSKYLEMPAQAINCCLVGPLATVDSDAFAQLTTSGRLVIKVKAVMKSQRYLVDVILDALPRPIAPSPPVAVVPPAGYLNAINCFPTGYLGTANPLVSGYPNTISTGVSGHSMTTSAAPSALHNPFMPGYATTVNPCFAGYPNTAGHFPSEYLSTTSPLLAGYPNVPNAVLPGYQNTSNPDPALTRYFSAHNPGPPGYSSVTTSAQDLAALMNAVPVGPKTKYQPLEFDTSQHQNVCISHVDEDGTFHCQLLQSAEAINSLMMMINFSPVVPFKSVPFEGMPCIIRSPYDRTLYRAKVAKQQPGSDRVIVELVDFGTKVETTVYDVHDISDAALMVPIQAITCRLYNAEDIPTEVLVPLLRRYDSKAVLIARVVGKVSPYLYVLELFDTSTDKDVRLLDVAKELAAQLMSPLPPPPKVKIQALPPQSCVPPAASISLTTSKQLFVTTTVDSHSFIGQFYPADDLKALQDEMHRYYSSNNVPCLANIIPGTFCCCQFMPNQRYYRAKVLRESQTQWVVEFVDSGVQEVKDRHQLKVLLPQFASLPLHSIRCILGNEYGKLTAELLNELLLERTVVVYFVGQTDIGYVVRLMECEMNQPILQQLNRSLPKQVLECDSNRQIIVKLRSLQSANARTDVPGFTQPSVPSAQWLACYVSFVESPSEFYCQLVLNSSALDSLMEEIVQNMKCNAPGLDSIQKAALGLPVLAKYSSDGLWYRARVTGVLKASNKVEVYFVDYGNRDTVAATDIKQIPSKIMSPPEMAISCTLAGLVKEDCVIWTTEEIHLFNMFVDQKELKLCYMEEKDRAGRFIVHLLDEQQNINRSFLRNTRKLGSGYASPVIKNTKMEPNEGDTVVSKTPAAAADRQRSVSSNVSNQSSGDGWPVKNSCDQPSGSWKQKTGNERVKETKGGPLFKSAIRDVISEQVKEKDEQTQSVGSQKGEYAAACPKYSGQSYGYIPLHLGQTFSATISFIFHPGKFFCQDQSNASTLDRLSEHLNGMYGNLGDGDNGFHMISLAKGQACCAKYSEDDMWYRAKVLTADSSSTATVQFVDFGNEETVPLMKIRSLHEKFFHIPVQSVQCSLYGVEPLSGEWSVEAVNLFEKLTEAGNLSVRVIEIDAATNGCKVDLLVGTSEGSIQARLVSAGCARSLTMPVQERGREQSTTVIQQTNKGSVESYAPCRVLNVGKSADVFVSFVVDPNRFWCQLVQEASQLDELMERLGNDYDALSANELSVAHPAVGRACCTRYSEDQQWYRATVIGFEKNQTKVHYVDYGNEDLVLNESIKAVKLEYAALAPQAFECSLLGIASATHGSWSAEAVASFSKLTEDRICNIVIRSNDKGRYEVELFGDKKNVSINSELVSSGFAIDASSRRSANTDRGQSETGRLQMQSRQQAPEQLPAKSDVKYRQQHLEIGCRKKVMPSWVTNPAEFYCQLVDNTKAIERLQETLFSSYHVLKPMEMAMMNPSPGDACAARYEQDGNWYRGQVLSIKGPVASVLYVDYGNVETVQLTKLKQLLEQFAEVPLQAVKCGLKGAEPQPKSPWSSNVLNRLADAFSRPICVIFKEKFSNCYLVEVMTEDGRCLNSEILGEAKVSLMSLTYKTQLMWKPEETREVEVVAVDDDGHFFCQLVGQADELDMVMAQLAEFYETLEGEVETSELKAGQTCVAKFSEDGIWYRARVESLAADGQILVRFVDYGNKELRPRSEVKSLKPQFCDLPVQAQRCALARKLGDGNKLIDVILGHQFKATLKKVVDEVLYVDLVGENGEVVGCHSETSDLSPSINSISEFKQKEQTVIPTDETSVCIINAISPTDFYVQLIGQEEEQADMGDRLHAEYSSLASDERCMTKFEIGQLCCAKFSEDSVWYRAKIQEVDGSLVKVLFVDYGNFDTVPNSDVKELCSLYQKIPFFAKRCSLKGVVCPTNGWSEDEIKKFVGFTQAGEKVFSCAFITTEEPFDVVLRDGNEDVGAFFSRPNEEELASETSASATDASTFAVFVTHVNSPSDFFIQFSNNQDKLDQMTAELDKYISDAPVLENLSIGSKCASIYSLDDAWYRAVIQEIHGDGTATVFFLDYGNTDTVNTSSLKTLNEALLAISPFASSCSLVDLPASPEFHSSSAGEVVAQTTAEKELEAHVVGCIDNKLQVNLAVDGTNMLNILTEELSKSCVVPGKELANYVNDDHLTKDEVEPSCDSADADAATDVAQVPGYADAVVTSGKFKVIVSSVRKADSVFLQLAKDSAELESLLDLLDESYAYLKPGELDLIQEAVVGQACCVCHSKVWYRATVEEVHEDGTLSVCFVDYGGVKVVSAKDVKQALPKLLNMRALAFKCHLVGCRPENKDEQAVNDRLQEFVKDKVLTAQISVVEGSLPRVLLYNRDICINSDVFGIPADELLKDIEETEPSQDKLAPKNESSNENEFAESRSQDHPPSPVSVGKVLQVHVTSASSPLDFWVTCPDETFSTDLPLLMDQIEDVYSSFPADQHLIQEPQVGMLCVAKYSDGIWYRAKILAVLESGMVQVLFIDYGNSFEVPASEVRELVAEYMEPPPQAVKGYLATVEPCDPLLGWDEASSSRFVELVTYESKPFEFHVSKVVRSDSGQLLELHGLLLDDGIDIGGELVKEGYARAVTAENEILNSCVTVPGRSYNAVANIPVISSNDFETRGETTAETNSDEVTVTHDEPNAQPNECVCEPKEYANDDDQYAAEDDAVSKCPEELNAQADSPSSYPLPDESDDQYSQNADELDRFETALEYVGVSDARTLEFEEIASGSVEYADGSHKHVDEHVHSDQQIEFTDDLALAKEVDYADDSNQYADGSNQYADDSDQCADEPNQYADEPNQYADDSNQYAEEPNQYADDSNQYAEEPNQYAEESGVDVCEPNELVDESEKCESSAATHYTDVSNAEKWIEKGFCDEEQMTNLLQSAAGDAVFKQDSKTGEMPDSVGTVLQEDVDLNDTETSSDTFQDSFLELSLHKHDSLGDLTKITRTFTSDALAYPFVGLMSGDVIQVAVVSIQAQDDIICQPVSSLSQLNDLMINLQTFCQGEETNLDHPESSQPCAAFVSQDSRWYRAQVTKVLEDGSLEVYCVDYGFLKHVMPKHVQLLQQQFMALPAQALHLSVTTDKQDLSSFQSLLPGTTVVATITEADSSNRRAIVKFSLGTPPAETTYTGVLTEGTVFEAIEDIPATGFSEDFEITADGAASEEPELESISRSEDPCAQLCDDNMQEEALASVDRGAVDDKTCLAITNEEDLTEAATVAICTAEGVALQNDQPIQCGSDLSSAANDDLVNTECSESISVIVSKEENVSVKSVDENDAEHMEEFDSSHAETGKSSETVALCAMSVDVTLKSADADCDVETVTDRDKENECESVPSLDKNEGEDCTAVVEILEQESWRKEETEGTHVIKAAGDEERDLNEQRTPEADVFDSDACSVDAIKSSNGFSFDTADHPCDIPAPDEHDTIQSSEKDLRELLTDDADLLATQLTGI